MSTITIRSHVGADGILKLQLPIGYTDADIEVTLTIKPVIPPTEVKTPEELGWSPGFFEKTFGAWEGEALIREPQEEPQERNWDDLFT
jgi:hypothetical protein